MSFDEFVVVMHLQLQGRWQDPSHQQVQSGDMPDDRNAGDPCGRQRDKDFPINRYDTAQSMMMATAMMIPRIGEAKPKVRRTVM